MELHHLTPTTASCSYFGVSPKADFDIGIQQTNIMVGAPGTEYVGPLPGYLNDPCPSSVALLKVSKEPEASRAMIQFMISPEAAPLLRKTHVEPAKP